MPQLSTQLTQLLRESVWSRCVFIHERILQLYPDEECQKKDEVGLDHPGSPTEMATLNVVGLQG
jgi:hypothetical protein